MAKAFLTIRITVQDPQEFAEKDRLFVSAALYAERIMFQIHDVFHVQEAVANAYLLRQISHDWLDYDQERIGTIKSQHCGLGPQSLSWISLY